MLIAAESLGRFLYLPTNLPNKTQLLLMEEILHQLRLVVYAIIYRVLHIPGGARFLPSTVVPWIRHGEWKDL